MLKAFKKTTYTTIDNLYCLTKTLITPNKTVSLSDFRWTPSYMFYMSKLLSPYSLYSCTFLTSGYTLVRQKQ